jgi:hypothetical protein
VAVRIPAGRKRIHDSITDGRITIADSKQKPGAKTFITPGLVAIFKSHVRVARGKHRGEPRGFFFAPAFLAGLFEMPMAAHDLEGPFAVDFFLKSPQRTFHWLAFFQSNLGQRNSLPFRGRDKNRSHGSAKLR